jgi:hypothetical protein
VAEASASRGKLPFPDGAIIAALHWNEASSDENDRVLASGFPGAGLQSFVATFMPPPRQALENLGFALGWCNPAIETSLGFKSRERM